MSTTQKRNILLLDLPTFPKGVISLSLLNVASCLQGQYNVLIEDLNILGVESYKLNIENPAFIGLKVSSQSVAYATKVTKEIRLLFPSVPVVWGGELPTLMPDYCLQYADVVISGLFEPISNLFINDLESHNLQRKYTGENSQAGLVKPNFELLPRKESYYQFMGYPMETSRGCTEKCIFCMVHTMQKRQYNLSSIELIRDSLLQYKGKFINIIDYNFGVSAEHVIEVSKLIERSEAKGWMAEMCIDLLDNDDVLIHMQKSGCRIIYCGLESIDQLSLNSIHKMHTNHIENYERIIRKAQSYGIQIAAGIILGLEGTHKNTFKELFEFYNRMGIIYAKLTFLTYNPGTKTHEYVRRKGTYVTENIECYDGNQLTFVPAGVDTKYVAQGTEWFIGKFYSFFGIISRSFMVRQSLRRRIEFILFNICYRDAYVQWINHDTLRKPSNNKKLIQSSFKKTAIVKVAEYLLTILRNK
jgi:radical SAM superfamily enzyme YgiQ (UPF0313 family)